MTDYRILITGSRNWDKYSIIEKAILGTIKDAGVDPYYVVIVEGGAMGADTLAKRVADDHGIRYEEHRADWSRLGKRAGHVRNFNMVKEGANVCLAFPLADSKGTWHCASIAHRVGMPVYVYDPTGFAYEYRGGPYDACDDEEALFE